MIASTVWFMGLVLACVGMAMAGRRVGKVCRPRAVIAVSLLGLLLLAGLSHLGRRSDLLLAWFPLSMAEYLEGTAAMPMLAMLLGLACSRVRNLRQRIVVGGGVAVGLLIFLHASLWMVLPTPTQRFSTEAAGRDARQSTDYSCVATACATTLGELGHPTSEAQMAILTRTRPMLGASIVRAVRGLHDRLDGESIRPHVVRGGWQALRKQPMPSLCLLQFEPGRVHMVTVLKMTDAQALIVDPSDGQLWFPRDAFERHSQDVLISFRSRPDPMRDAQLASADATGRPTKKPASP